MCLSHWSCFAAARWRRWRRLPASPPRAVQSIRNRRLMPVAAAAKRPPRRQHPRLAPTGSVVPRAAHPGASVRSRWASPGSPRRRIVGQRRKLLHRSFWLPKFGASLSRFVRSRSSAARIAIRRRSVVGWRVRCTASGRSRPFVFTDRFRGYRSHCAGGPTDELIAATRGNERNSTCKLCFSPFRPLA